MEIRETVEKLLATRDLRLYGIWGMSQNDIRIQVLEAQKRPLSDLEGIERGFRIALPYMDEMGLREMAAKLERCGPRPTA